MSVDMKVAMFSDVQANLPAMEVAVEQILDWRPDLVVMAGDIVNRGPSSLACVELFDQLRRERGWLPVQGNHETWILHCADHKPATPLDTEMWRFAYWTYEQIAERIDAIRDWPDHLCFHAEAPDSWVHVTHGTMKGNRDGISVRTPDHLMHEKLPEDISVFVTGHTHKPLERIFDAMKILNLGSVGSPFDGDPRGSYARMQFRQGRWQTEIVRFQYDRQRADRAFSDSGFLDEGGPIARILYQEWRLARALMPDWRKHHEPAVLSGERPLEEAVTRFLNGLGN